MADTDAMLKDFEQWKQENGVVGGGTLLDRIYFAGWQKGQSRTLASRPAEVGDEGLLKECKRFLEDMHAMPVEWTINESQVLHQKLVHAEKSRRNREITELINNPLYGEPDLYSRLHTALTDEVGLAKKFGKLPQWFEAARSLVDWLERESKSSPSHTTNKEK
jgi:hypothetical protein